MGDPSPTDGGFPPDAAAAAAHLRGWRWDDEVRCVHCGSNDVVRNGRRDDHIQKYLCRGCGTAFNDRTGTVFEATDMPLPDCLYALRADAYDPPGDWEFTTNRIAEDRDRHWATIDRFLTLARETTGPYRFAEQVHAEMMAAADG